MLFDLAGGPFQGARDPVRVRQPRRRVRHSVQARADGHRLAGALPGDPGSLRGECEGARPAPAEALHGKRQGHHGTLRIPGEPGPAPQAHLQGLRRAGRLHGQPDAARALRRLPPHHRAGQGEGSPPTQVYDVTGSLCENNDKFAIDRSLPRIEEGDLVVIHDTGAHGCAMGFNYNGKLRSAELLLRPTAR